MDYNMVIILLTFNAKNVLFAYNSHISMYLFWYVPMKQIWKCYAHFTDGKSEKTLRVLVTALLGHVF